MSEKDGGAAFPSSAFAKVNDDGGIEYVALTNGMTLRDYFAGQVITRTQEADVDDDNDSIEALAEWAYQVADAMLKERAK